MKSEEEVPSIPQEQQEESQSILPIKGMYQNWFLEYASYVILERAVPSIEDGLKPVQRRILHAMKEIDDGRYNKVANIIGQTMQYHPHGDASIGDAITNLGQKDFLIDTQGNWGDVRTGDSAAAARYTEARLSKFALEVLYSPQVTEWQSSYDGRKKEPIALPAKFPLLLLQGVEGIAVGLSTKILPHNFCELIQESINVLKGKKPNLLPDFPTGGTADCSDYNEGLKGGKVRIRANIEVVDKKTLVIKDIPYATTTTSVIDSIIKAHDKGKIKIKSVVDNTAEDIEILITLPAGESPAKMIDALYVFTDCEVSISPNNCVIIDEKPVFISANDLLIHNTQSTKDILEKELKIKHAALQEQLLFASLEKIFIEKRIYRDIEECTTWEAVLSTIDKGLTPYKKDFYRPITEEDLVRLTEIKIKRISKYDSNKAEELLSTIKGNLEEVEHHLANLVPYAIEYYKSLLTRYGKGRERKTTLRTFDTIVAHTVASNNEKLYINREEGFIGYGIKKDEFISECSDIDDVIVFKKDGTCLVTKIAEKVFVGKGILHAAVFKKGDERRVYNLLYVDSKTRITKAKRFQVLAVTRDKPYEIAKGRILHFTNNANGEAEVLTLVLSPMSKARKKVFDFDFSTLAIKGRAAQGNSVTKYTVKKVRIKEAGKSTFGGLTIWYDPAVGRLNTDQRGRELGSFADEDRILSIYKDGSFMLTNYELTHRFDPEEVVYLEKWNPETIFSVVYYHGKHKQVYTKRCLIPNNTVDRRYSLITEDKGSKLQLITDYEHPQLLIHYRTAKKQPLQKLPYDLNAVDIKGWKAAGIRLSKHLVSKVELSKSEPQPTPSITE